MSISDIALGGAMRANLNSLSLTSALMGRTSERLASGLKVNSAVDDPTAFFAAQAHRSRAADLAARKDGMGEALQTISAASNGIEAITALIEQAKGIVDSARSASAADAVTLAAQYTEVLAQIDSLAGDSGYKGVNLLEDGGTGSLTVSFNEGGTSTLTITGFDATADGLAMTAAVDFTLSAELDTHTTELDTALGTLRTNAKALAANSGVVTARQEFTNGMINALKTGADMLTVADENEESANMLALQTRQQISIATMGMASQAAQSILRLF
jgi:flagellin-like hook-associated protein FlgL